MGFVKTGRENSEESHSSFDSVICGEKNFSPHL